MTAKEKKQRKQIVELLKSKNLYELSDEILIDELIFLQGIIQQSKEMIMQQGVMVNVRTDPGKPKYEQVNQVWSIYKDALKSLVTVCIKLGVTPQERSKLKLIEKQGNGFDLNKFLNDN